jgi:glycosyltransferase involved in cell wall biosynthesis
MGNTLNICLVNPDFIPMRGSGVAVYAEKIARGLAVNHNVTFISSKIKGTSPTEWIDNIHVIRIPGPGYDPSKWIAFSYKTAKFLHRQRADNYFDIVHFLDAHLGYAYRGQFVATLHQSFNQRVKGSNGLPYASSFFNLIKRYPYYIFAKFLEKKALKKAKAFISVSHATKCEFIQNYKVTASITDVVYNGIDTNFFKPSDTEYLKKKLGLHDEKILLYVGFTTPRKGVETLAQALIMLREQNIRLIIVGKWEKGYRKKFFSYLGEKTSKVIEAGYIQDSEMPAYYTLADIFVLPSLLEGFGFTLVEAMACRTPVVSTNVGAISEVLGDCGIIIPPQNSGLLAEAIDRLLLDRQLSKKLKEKSRERVCKNFSESVMIEKTVGFYRKVIEAKKISN